MLKLFMFVYVLWVFQAFFSLKETVQDSLVLC